MRTTIVDANKTLAVQKDARRFGYIKVPYGSGCTKIKYDVLKEITEEEGYNYVYREADILQSAKGMDYNFIPFNDCDKNFI